jgi:hypothetical protein
MFDPSMRYQLIMRRLMEPGKAPDITRGTLEGRIKTGRLCHSSAGRKSGQTDPSAMAAGSKFLTLVPGRDILFFEGMCCL